MAIKRASGLLLHITSLPGGSNCGTMGREAEGFIDFLAASGQSYWQILPLGPVCPHWNFSPYSSPSAFAGNELLISPEKLYSQGMISAADLEQNLRGQPLDSSDLEGASRGIQALLFQAVRQALAPQNQAVADEFERFCQTQKTWLDDYALFRALADHFQTFQWTAWPEAIAHRQGKAVEHWRQELREATQQKKFGQYVFFKQWLALKRCANRHGVKLIGDIPFYVNFESADAWACPEIFQLDEKTGLPAAVAGVPPDYFSATGQRWGNPLYHWQEGAALHAPTLAWWTARVRHLLQLVDMLRIDHFRGFDTYWAIPASEPTAVNGQWRQGPGMAFFEHLKRELGNLPLIAEDLGELTPGVEALRDRLGFPGMKILQFAFDGSPNNPYLPHNYANANCLVYTGTHDNNTSNGWFYGSEASEKTKQNVMNYLQSSNRDEFHWQFIQLAMRSNACLAIFPVQDVLGLDERFRMNTPGRAQGNWCWRLTPGALTSEIGQKLKELTRQAGRLPEVNTLS
jgi:4-alpha-glucanotransferase